MPRTSEPIGSGTGNPASKMLRNWVDIVSNGALRMRFIPFGKYRDKNWSLFSCGKYRDHSSQELGERVVVLPIDPLSESASGDCVEIGLLGPQDPEDVSWQWIAGWVEEAEITDSKRLRIQWSAIPTVVVATDNPIQSVTVSGATRFVNCQEIEEFPNRARITVKIQKIGTTNYVYWYAGNKLVSSGSRTGDGAVILTEENDSGLSGACVLTYTADVSVYFDLRWAAAYRIHVSSSPIVWTDTPTATVYDRGTDSFSWLSTTLAAGPVYFGVRAVGDDGVLEISPSEASNSPLTVVDIPEPPTNLSASGTYDNLQISWTNSITPSCSYTVYSSLVDEPCNVDNMWPDPIPVTTGIGATSATIPVVANYASWDKTSAWSTFTTACETWEAAINATLDSSIRATHSTLVAAAKDDLLAAINVLGDAIDRDLSRFIQAISLFHSNLINAGNYAGNMTDTDWESHITSYHSALLNAMSLFYNGKKGNFLMPDGTVPTSSTNNSVEFSIYNFVTPLVQNRIVRVIVRATHAGIQEKSDEVLEVELDNSGNVVVARPTEPALEGLSADGLEVTANAMWVPEDSPSTADYIQLWVTATGVAPNPAVPSASEALVAGINGVLRATPSYTVGAEGYYDIYIAAYNSSTTGQSLLVGPKTRWISADEPYTPQSVVGQIIRSG